MTTISRRTSFLVATALAAASCFASAAAPPAPVALSAGVPDSRFPDVEWRLVGPHRGGWGTMGVGVPGRPDTYYFGAAGGGVWKTTDSGRVWRPITDSQPIGAVGALAVAPSNPDVLYVGTGHPEPRYDIIAGTGVYRSTDGGATWQSAGLAGSRHVGDVIVDPRDANVVVVAALGAVFGPSAERGVFRSTDGGRTWSRTLFVDDVTGAVDLAQDPANPDVLYATTWTVKQWPWLSYFTPIEGEGSALWRSRDGGRTWSKVGGEGWPAGPMGRIGTAAAHVGGATRLYATVTKGGGGGGFYRSDDDGAHWQKLADTSWVTNWYMSRITVSPVNPDVVYTVGQSLHESRDGGRTWTVFRGAPGGDDFHYLWIDPKDPQRMIATADQGAIVSVNGGATWGEWYNQPTGQFYYLATDNRFPYRIYSGQQDSGTVRIASRGEFGAISYRDWQPVGADERDYDIPDPEDSEIVYGTGLGGRISRWDSRTGQSANVTPWPVSSYGKRATDFRFHYHWFTPLAVSRATPKGKPHALYAGSQVLWRSYDRGEHWEVISPDLSGANGRAAPKHLDAGGAKDARGAAAAPECGKGSPTPPVAFACGYGVINTIVPSPRTDDEIWLGTDDGRVWLTRDAGKSWKDVTPPGIPQWAKIASVDPSTIEDGVAYVAVDNHRQDDFTPRAFRTRDHGASWTSIVGGLPKDRFVAVLRADPVRAGLLYAGTDLGVHVSFDDGAHWQSLQKNLPPAWVHDLLVKGTDLIAATNGRALWVLDDVTPLRQVATGAASQAVLYRPAPAVRIRPSSNHDTPLPQEMPQGRNPPTGAVIDYWLPADAKLVTFEVRDAKGELVRRITSADPEHEVDAERYFHDDWVKPDPRPAATAGAHRFVWNLRYPRPKTVEYQFGIQASWTEGTPINPQGPLALAGDYTVTLLVDGRKLDAPLTIVPDPRVTVAPADVAQGVAFARDLAADLKRSWRGYAEVEAVREQLEERRKAASAATSPNAKAAVASLDALDAKLGDLVGGTREDAASFGVQGGILTDIATDVTEADRAPTAAQREVARLARERLATADATWSTIKAKELPAVGRALAGAKLAALKVPAEKDLKSPEAPEAEDLP
jgi:photosystem II stability/assembly factor-like uncharacterized protein